MYKQQQLYEIHTDTNVVYSSLFSRFLQHADVGLVLFSNEIPTTSRECTGPILTSGQT